MDKSWIQLSRLSDDYDFGVESFLDFAFEYGAPVDGQILCPCVKCRNRYWWRRSEVYSHLISNGFIKEYTSWVFHGEREDLSPTDHDEDNHTDINEGYQCDDMDGLLNDRFRHTSEGPNEESKNVYKLIEEGGKELYPGCKNFSKLSFTVRLYLLKCLNSWSNASFTALLELLKEAMPYLEIPESFNKTKSMVKDLGSHYVKIDACPNDCMLYWKQHLEAKNCHVCGASRWKTNENAKSSVTDKETTTSKKIPAKILRHFPLIPRLKMLFLSSKIAGLMQWHEKERSRDGKLRHPADAEAWKHFDSLHPDFANDPRNVRLGLASDGFNPFGTMSISHSTWPVLLIPYNLPPWMCMKPEYTMLSLLIPGPSSPGNDIDVYLQPLIEELKELWEFGVEAYDSSSDQTFQMRATLLWTINDFPAYAMLSGWSTKGKLACPCCNYDTCYRYLKHSRKVCYADHRVFLEMDHPWRRDKKSFNGKTEMRPAPAPLSGEEVFECVHDINHVFGKKKKKLKNESPWKKRSIFFELSYWKDIKLRHNLDVMHIEKNVFDSIIGTLLDISGKTKDHLNSRLDLRDMGIRNHLHPVVSHDGKKTSLAKAPFAMTPREKDIFCSVFKRVKLPAGSASNISRCVQVLDRKISGYKSHDAHFMLHHILPIAAIHALPKLVASALVRLSTFFRVLCGKVIQLQDLEFLQKEIIDILCRFEKIFPPSFFDIMVHLLIHLANEARLGGPVAYRWMYFVERYMGRLKSYVRNRSRPEGSMAECYIAQECLIFCSLYLHDDVETRLKRSTKNWRHNPENDGTPSLFSPVGYPIGGKNKKGKILNLEVLLWTQAHRYILFNTDEVSSYISEHEDFIRNQSKKRKWDKAQAHSHDFIEWFKLRVAKEIVSDRITNLSIGPNFVATTYTGYAINGYEFHTKQRDERCKTQNSGVTLTATTSSFSSTKDKNPVAGDVVYYGAIRQIIELNYFGHFKAVVFECDWYEVEQHAFGLTRVNFNKCCYINDPIILASQAHQCFYVEDPSDSDLGWNYALKIMPRDIYDMTDNYDSALGASTLSETTDFNVPSNVDVENDDIEYRHDLPATVIDTPLEMRESCQNTVEVEEETDIEEEGEDDDEEEEEIDDDDDSDAN